jgi:hypothetical protein
VFIFELFRDRPTSLHGLTSSIHEAAILVKTPILKPSGKTTVSVQLAVAALLAGEWVAILDIDQQRPALIWAETRRSVSLLACSSVGRSRHGT